MMRDGSSGTYSLTTRFSAVHALIFAEEKFFADVTLNLSGFY
jgi:hypothetical protein